MPPRSAILSLPESVRAELDRKLIQGGFQDYRGLSEWLAEQGFEIGKSAIHNYGSEFEKKLAALKIATDQAKAIADAAPDETNAMNDALIRLVQQKAFEVLMNLNEEGEDVSIKDIGLMVARLSNASVKQKQYGAEVRAKLQAELEAMKKEGFDGATLDAVQKRVAVYLPDNGR
jgi:hypothetical protein